MSLLKGREMVFKALKVEYFQNLKNQNNQNNRLMMLNISHLVMIHIN